MPKEGSCRICEFFQKPYRQSEKETFNKLVREGVSLRRLEVFFQALNLKVKKDAINSHLHKCMSTEVSTQREIEKETKKEGIRRIGKRVKDFLIKPDLPKIEECSHTVTVHYFDVSSEMVITECKLCGKILGSQDPERSELERDRDPRNLVIYRSLRKE